MRQHFLSTSRRVLVGSVHPSMRPRIMSRSRRQRPGVTSAVDAESMPFRGTTRSRRWRRVSRPLLEGRSESPWESVMRVLHRTAGIDVEPQKEIYDDGGRFVARADLWLVGTRRIHEYDGELHRDRAARRWSVHWPNRSPHICFSNGNVTVPPWDNLSQ